MPPHGKCGSMAKDLILHTRRRFGTIALMVSTGDGGSGPAQLALAICLQLMSKDDAQSFYQHLKYHVIAELPKGKDFEDDFTIEPAKP